MPRQTEPNANNALGDILRGMMPGCDARSENTQTFSDHPGRHADVLVTCPPGLGPRIPRIRLGFSLGGAFSGVFHRKTRNHTCVSFRFRNCPRCPFRGALAMSLSLSIAGRSII